MKSKLCRSISILLSLAMMLTMLAACGGSGTASTTAAPTTAAPTTAAQTTAAPTTAAPTSASASEAPLNWPNHEITFILPVEPGGGVDSSMRILAPFLAEELGVPVIIENQPGGGYALGYASAFQRPADGYTLTVGTTTANPWILETMSETSLPFKGSDFQCITQIGQNIAPMGVAVQPGKWDTLVEFVNDVRAAPGKYTMGLQGPGSTFDPVYLTFSQVLGLEFNVVYYSGSGDQQTDLITGDVDAIITSLNRPVFVGHTEIQTLCLFGDHIPDDYPTPPGTFPLITEYGDEIGFDWEKDAGYMRLEAAGSILMMKTGTDQKILDTLYDAVVKVIANPDYRELAIQAGTYFYKVQPTPQDMLDKMHFIQEALEAYKATIVK